MKAGRLNDKGNGLKPPSLSTYIGTDEATEVPTVMVGRWLFRILRARASQTAG
jgi:hypothetical protein